MIETVGALVDWDPIHTSGRHGNHWTSTNVGEAAPGVLTPLASSHWAHRIDRAAMQTMYNIGVLSREECFGPREPAECAVRLFSGRIGCRLEYITIVGDRMPGVSGEGVLKRLLNEAPDTVEYHPTRRRYPMIAAKLAYQYATSHARLRTICAETDRLWRNHVDNVPRMDEAALINAVGAGFRLYEDTIRLHMTTLFASIQPTYDALDRLIAVAGTGDISVLSGTGGAEMAVVTDTWLASRGEFSVEDVVRRHGFHGPREGEVSSVVWREDNSPLRTVIEHYIYLPSGQSPMASEVAKAARFDPMRAEVLARLPARSRPAAKVILRLARERVPDRGRGKRAYLQSIDISRMAARRLGVLWSKRGVLERSDDVFFLTEHEVAALPAHVHELVAYRRERTDLYRSLDFRDTYGQGKPQMVPCTSLSEHARVTVGAALTGTGASAGVVEGIVRVVDDPTFDDVVPGEILVAKTTDPSWCTIMFVSAALVVDLGGALSHAAVVAREIGIPCVVNMRDGTRRLRSGDHVRVDGTAGTVTVLATVST